MSDALTTEDLEVALAQARAHISVLRDAHDAVLRIHTSRCTTSQTGDSSSLFCRECLSPYPCPTVDALGGGL